VTGPALTLNVASNAGSWSVVASKQPPLNSLRIARIDTEITGVTGGRGDPLVGEGDGAGETGGCDGSGRGSGGGRSTVFSMLPGVIEAFSGIVPSLTTVVNGTAAVVRVT
jgi:hypothetical protein